MLKNAPQGRYTWKISIDVEEEENFALYEGPESRQAFGKLFAIWTQNRGDLSQWDDAGIFGGIVSEYSDLTPDVVAVWLGLTPDKLSTPKEVNTKLIKYNCRMIWKLTYKDGNRMKITRTFEA